MAGYRAVLAVPGLPALSAVAFLARIPASAAAVTITLYVVLTLGHGYAAAGSVGAATTVGTALGPPLLGRVADAHGLRPVLVLALVSAAAFWSVAPVLGLPALLAGPRLQRYEIINWNISNVSLILFVVDISLLGPAQLIRDVAVFPLRRRQYRELEALWTELRQAQPELVLGDRIGNRLQRRIIECFDGLARMSPYIGVAANRADISTCTEAELAVYLRQALALKAELDGRPEDMAPVELPVAALQDATGADVNLLVSLARAFRAQQPTARAA
jgi:deoxyinosine 3'endonuclease (endonuclease V)